MGTAVVIMIVVFTVAALIGGIWIGFMFGLKVGLSRAGKNPRESQRPVFGAILVALGPCFAVAALGSLIYMWHFTRTALHAQGTILEMLQQTDKDGAASFAPTFIFKDNTGVQHAVSSSIYQSPPEFHVGDKVTVLYLADNPEKARIDSFSQVWEVPSVLGIFGGVAFLIGMILLRWPRIVQSVKRQLPNAFAT